MPRGRVDLFVRWAPGNDARSQRALLVATTLACMLLASHSRASELRRTAFVRAIDRARPSVVNIDGQKTLHGGDRSRAHAEEERQVHGMGTGVIIDERGYIMTNHHVVDGVRQIHVTLEDGREFLADLVAHDVATDLAIVKIDALRTLTTVPVGTSSDLMTGEPVIAVGNAYGYDHTVTRGIISALHRRVRVSDLQEYEDLIQTDASINPGNSGGPLLNIDGEMIGINVAVRAGAHGIGFAIPADIAMDVAAEMLNIRRVDRNWHGLVVEPGPREPRPGVMVRKIENASPAATSGLTPGDLITSVDHRRVERPLDLELALLGRNAGESFEVTAMRENQEIKTKVVLAQWNTSGGSRTDPAWRELGLRLKPVRGDEFPQSQTNYRGGLEVLAVRPLSPAAEQGIRRGDILVGMHIYETVSLENVEYVLKQNSGDQRQVKYYILRAAEPFYGFFLRKP